MRHKPAILLLLACTHSAIAQGWTRLHFSFEEVDATTHQPVAQPTGKIQPGQAALITMSISFEPPVGTLIDPPWAVHALGFTSVPQLQVLPLEESGTWSALEHAPGWSGNPGTAWPCCVMGITVAQDAAGADQGNPVDVWRGVWTPDVYTDRSVTIGAACMVIHGMCSSLWLADTTEPGTYTSTMVRTNSGAVEVPISSNPVLCYADCDNDGTLNINDFLCFIDEFASGSLLPTHQQVEHYANCDGSTAAPVLTISDFLCFIDEFAAGCP